MAVKRDAAILVIALAVLVALGALRAASPQRGASVPSTYDTGPQGYAALYELLQRENVDVARYGFPLARLTPQMQALAIVGEPAIDAALHEKHAKAAVRAWLKRGGRLVLIGVNAKSLKDLGLQGTRGVVAISDAARFDNAHLPKRGNALAAYRLFAGSRVAFDEFPYGFVQGESFWDVLPAPVHWAVWVALAALLLAIAGANLPFAPAAVLERSVDRDSSEYLASLARLLARAGAARDVLVRLAREVPDPELQSLAQASRIGPRMLLEAGVTFAKARKDGR